MKKLTLALSLITLLSFAAPPPVNVKLAWQDTNIVTALSQYVPTTNNCYILIGTNNLSAPISTWPTLAVFTSWTLGTNNGIWYTNSVNVAPDNWFFSIIASNFWGLAAVPSNVAQTGPVSTPPVNFNLSR